MAGQNRPAGKRNNRNNRGGAAKRDTRFTQRAQTNVELQDQSQVNLLQNQLQDAQRDYLREGQAAQSVWGGGGEEIRDLPRPQFDRIGQEFNQGASSYADLFGGVEGMPAAEVGAGNALGLARGEATHGMLANLDAREGLARSSAARQMNLAGKYAQDNVIQRMEDAVRGYNDQLGQVRADDPWQISQEVQTLRDQALQEQLARSKMRSDAALSEWLQGYVGGGGGGGGGVRGGGGGGGGGGYTGPVTSQGRPDWAATHGYPANQGPQGVDYEEDPYAQGWRPATRQAVRNADYLNDPDMPGWVRYAFNHGGASALNDPRRRRLYRNSLADLMARFDAAQVPVAQPPIGGGFNF